MKPADHLAPPNIDWLIRSIANLEREVRELRAERRLPNSSMDAGNIQVKGGALTVYDTDGNLVARIGDQGDGTRGVTLYRAGGEVAFQAHGTDAGARAGYAALYDREGTPVIGDDPVSNRGIARPYIPLQIGELTVPTATTTQSTFTDAAGGAVTIQHPALYAYLLVYSSAADTTGEVRLALDGTGIGDTITVAGNDFAVKQVMPFSVPDPGPMFELRTLSVQARRTAGTGVVGVRPLSILGLEYAYIG